MNIGSTSKKMNPFIELPRALLKLKNKYRSIQLRSATMSYFMLSRFLLFYQKKNVHGHAMDLL